MTCHQRGHVVATDTWMSGALPGLIGDADRVRICDVITEEDDPKIVKGGSIERISWEDRRGVTHVDVVDVSFELEGQRNG